MVERRFVQPDDLAALVHEAFGSVRRLVGLDRLVGGSKKGVYRLTLDDGTTSILYVWNDDENYWSAPRVDLSNPFSDASGMDLLTAAHEALAAAGARVPALFLVDGSKRLYTADLVLAEDLRGGTLQDLIATDRGSAAAPLRELGRTLEGMAAHRNVSFGKVGAVAAGLAPQGRAAQQVVLDQARRHLSLVVDEVPTLGAARERIAARFDALFDRLTPRSDFGLIHGELGADHVMIDGDGRAVIIDIEGLMYFDVEWEHDFTRMRFGEAYDGLEFGVALDPDRLAFYELARSLSLVEGPLRIIKGDFPHRDFMLGIAKAHTAKVLRLSGVE